MRISLWCGAARPIASWFIQSAGSQIALEETEAALLPDLVISVALADENELRQRLTVPNTILEQLPFARQWADTRWRYMAQEDAVEFGGAAHPGYNLQDAKLRSSPLTTLAYLLQNLRGQNLSDASNYATRLDLLQQAFDLGLSEPAIWIAYYLDDNDNQIFGNATSNRIRFFDNANRACSFTAFFEIDADGNYRVAAIEPAPAYEPTDLDVGHRCRKNKWLIQASVTQPTEGGGEEGHRCDAYGDDDADLYAFAYSATHRNAHGCADQHADADPDGDIDFCADRDPDRNRHARAHGHGDCATHRYTVALSDSGDPHGPGSIPVCAIVFRFPSNLRAGPSVEYPSLAANYGIPVDLFGITEAGDWVFAAHQCAGRPAQQHYRMDFH